MIVVYFLFYTHLFFLSLSHTHSDENTGGTVKVKDYIEGAKKGEPVVFLSDKKYAKGF